MATAEYMRRWRLEHPKTARAHQLRHAPRRAELARLRRKGIRREVLMAYGGTCRCCSESRNEFLAIDHVNGGGNKHRLELEVGGSAGFYTWLKRNGFPPVFQVLCHNCNMARSIYGRCPHETEAEKTA